MKKPRDEPPTGGKVSAYMQQSATRNGMPRVSSARRVVHLTEHQREVMAGGLPKVRRGPDVPIRVRSPRGFPARGQRHRCVPRGTRYDVSWPQPSSGAAAGSASSNNAASGAVKPTLANSTVSLPANGYSTQWPV